MPLKSRFVPIFFLALLVSACASSSFLKTSDGVRLYYEFSRVKPEKGRIVMLHGAGMSHFEWDDLTSLLNGEGWSTLAPDLRGHGESRGEWGGRALAESGEFDKMPLDVEAAVRRAADAGRPLWLFGSSHGARLALDYAGKDPAVRGLVLFSPALGIDFEGNARAVQALNGRPVLLLASEDDPEIFRLCESLERDFPRSVTFMRLYGKGHAGARLAGDRATQTFLKQFLR